MQGERGLAEASRSHLDTGDEDTLSWRVGAGLAGGLPEGCKDQIELCTGHIVIPADTALRSMEQTPWLKDAP